MTDRRALVAAKREEIADAVHRHRGRSVLLFGSVARGDDHEASDIDFLVDFEEGSSLFDLLHLRDELVSILSHPVDVVALGGLTQRDQRLLEEAVAP